MARSNIRGITVEIDGNTSKLSTALRDVNKEARNTNGALRDIQKNMDLDPKNSAKLLAQKHRELGNAIKNTKEKLVILKKAQSQMTDEFKSTDEGKRAYDNLTREILATENELKSLEKQAKKSNDVVKSISETTGKISEKTGELGSALSTKLTAPIVAAGGVVTKFAGDFDGAMTGVAKTIEMTDSEFEEMKQGIRDMAKEMPATAVEIANVAEAAGQLGIQKEHVLDFAKVMIDLGETTNLTADEAASAFAKFANITQMPQTEFENLGSVVVELGNNLATTEADIVQLGTRLAASGTQAGFTEAEIMGLAGAMSSVGINAEAGGTAMSQVLQKIGKSVSLQDEKLKIFAQTAGMTAEEFSNAWKTKPREALQSLIEGLKKAGDNGENVDLILSELGITGVRETDTLKRLAGSGNLLSDSFDMANKAFEKNNALSEEAQKKYESFWKKIDIFKNKLIDAAITIGEKLMPNIEKATDKIGEFTDSFSKLDDQTIQRIIDLALALAALGPTLLIISQVTGAISGLLALFGGPITLAIGALVALGIAIYVFRDQIKDAIEKIKEDFEIAKQFFTDWVNNIKEKFERIKETVSENIESIKTTIVGGWQSIVDGTNAIWEGAKEAWTIFWTGVGDTLSGIWQGISDKANTTFTAIKDGITQKWEEVKTATSEKWESIKATTIEKAENIKTAVSEKWESIKTTTSEKWEAIKSKTSEIWEGMKSNASQKFESIKSTVSEKWNAIKSNTSLTWSNIKSQMSQNIDGAKSKVSGTVDGIKSKVQRTWNTIKSTTSTVWNGIKSAITGPINKARDAVSNAISRMKSILNISLPTPRLKLPHPRVSGSFSLNPPRVPKFSIDWYKKGAIFTKPTLFNTPYGMKGVGEAGAEAVLPIEKLSGIVAEALRMNQKSEQLSAEVAITGNTFNVREETDIEKIARELYRLMEAKKRGVGLG